MFDVEDWGNLGQNTGAFFSIVAAAEDGVVACGRVTNNDNNGRWDGLLVKLGNFNSELVIYHPSPEYSVLTVLRDDTLRFSVGAEDPLGRELSYLWIRNSL